MHALFIFRRDLRVNDNSALIKANEYCIKNKCKLKIIFIFNNEQIDKNVNEYYSQHSVNFMISSLSNLNKDLNNSIQFYQTSDEAQLLESIKENIKAVFYNKDYTPYAIKRDKIVKDVFKDIEVFEEVDYTLFDLNIIKTDAKKIYQVFTPFYRKCLENKKIIQPPNNDKIKIKNILKPDKKFDIDKFYDENIHSDFIPDRKHCLKILKNIKNFSDYKNSRNDLSNENGTTKLSPYLKFSLISVREYYDEIVNAFDENHDLIKQFFWKEFYSYITYHFPHILQGQIGLKNKPFNSKYIGHKVWIKSNKDKILFEKWKNAKTGFPIVDAAMNQLNSTGWMHNRSRMIVSMFLTKDLLLDWRLGEKYFATKLVDYDPASNSGGWQWSTSIGSDAAPYFRIFNPWLQSKRFDPKCVYIKKWIPDLVSVPEKDIHKWNETYMNYKNIDYPEPIVDHKENSNKIKDLFKNLQ